MPNYSFEQSEAETVFFSTYAALRESDYSVPDVIGVADTDVTTDLTTAGWYPLYQENA